MLGLITFRALTVPACILLVGVVVTGVRNAGSVLMNGRTMVQSARNSMRNKLWAYGVMFLCLFMGGFEEQG